MSFINECCKDHCDLWAFWWKCDPQMDLSCFLIRLALIYIHITVEEECVHVEITKSKSPFEFVFAIKLYFLVIHTVCSTNKRQ